jgi:hypothetical protein
MADVASATPHRTNDHGVKMETPENPTNQKGKELSTEWEDAAGRRSPLEFHPGTPKLLSDACLL